MENIETIVISDNEDQDPEEEMETDNNTDDILLPKTSAT